MTPHEVAEVIAEISVAGYWPRVYFKSDIDVASGVLRLALVARPIDAGLARESDKMMSDYRAPRRQTLVFDPSHSPLSTTRRVEIEMTRVDIRKSVPFDEWSVWTRDFLVAELGLMLKDFAIHEVEEFFRHQGRRVFNPHPEVPGYQDQK